MTRPAPTLSERLDIAARIHAEIGGQTAMLATIREAAALARMVEAAPVRKVISDGSYEYAGTTGLGLLGKRVRLVVEEPSD